MRCPKGTVLYADGRHYQRMKNSGLAGSSVCDYGVPGNNTWRSEVLALAMSTPTLKCHEQSNITLFANYLAAAGFDGHYKWPWGLTGLAWRSSGPERETGR